MTRKNKSFVYHIMAKVFQFVFHYRFRKPLILLKANFIYRVYGIVGVADYVTLCHSDYLRDILVRYGAQIGEKCYLKTQIQIEVSVFGVLKDFSNLRMGDRSIITKGVYLDLTDRIILGEEAVIGPHCVILTHQSVADRSMRFAYKDKYAPVVLERGAVLGSNSTIMPGVTIGECAVVAAGSVVTKSVLPFTVVGGIPAQKIESLTRELFSEEVKSKIRRCFLMETTR